ncbi:MAG TPA: methyltransferase domain-containing protein [Longimicrobium sp.]|nr:methyltransferase domain-containing protein [Longimicrobium sp.]
MDTGFDNVDGVDNTDALKNYLDVTYSLSQQRRAASIQLLGNISGCTVLEVGCGLGVDAITLGQLVGVTGRVIAVDKSKTFVTEAKRRGAPLNLPVEFLVDDISNLNLPSESVDAVFGDRVLQVLAQPAAAVLEVHRVLRRGGRAVFNEPDWETLVLDSAHREVTRRLLNLRCDRREGEGWMGRQLLRLFTEAGFSEIGCQSFPFIIQDFNIADQIYHFKSTVQTASLEGLISSGEGQDWLNDLIEQSRRNCFFCGITLYTIVGTKT